MTSAPVLWRRVAAEFLGSAFLAAVVIGSGIAAQRLSPGQTGLQLLENSAATAAGLFAIILMFGPVSGGHFNPVVSFVDAAFGGLSWREAAAYLPAQVAGCIAGAVVANLMFALPAVSISAKHRASAAHFLSEVIATAGLLLVIFALARSGRSRSAPAAVGAYIGAAYWFTSSTSFANPAITIGRMFSDTFAGIAPSSVPPFIAAQILGGLRDHEAAAAAGFDPITVGSEADDHKAYYPGSHRVTMRVTGDRATGRLLGLQLFGHRHAEIAKRIDIAATAIFNGMTVDAVSDLDLSYTPPLGSPWEAVQMGAQAWTRAT